MSIKMKIHSSKRFLRGKHIRFNLVVVEELVLVEEWLLHLVRMLGGSFFSLRIFSASPFLFQTVSNPIKIGRRDFEGGTGPEIQDV